VDIGIEKPAIIVEPLEDPFREATPTEPIEAPVVPEREPEPVRNATAASGGDRG
jgi:hypothetical protein